MRGCILLGGLSSTPILIGIPPILTMWSNEFNTNVYGGRELLALAKGVLANRSALSCTAELLRVKDDRIMEVVA